jgi:hypothetical protein
MPRRKRARSESEEPEPDRDAAQNEEHAQVQQQQQPGDRREQMADIARRSGSCFVAHQSLYMRISLNIVSAGMACMHPPSL